MCFARGIRHVTTTPYYPQPSHAERFGTNLRVALVTCHRFDHSRWGGGLTWLQFAFNAARRGAHEDSPFRLMMSFASNSPLSNLWSVKDQLLDDPDTISICDCWNAARRNLRLADNSARRKYNRTRKPRSATSCYSPTLNLYLLRGCFGVFYFLVFGRGVSFHSLLPG